MQKRVQFQDIRHLSGKLDSKFDDDIEYLFSVDIVNSEFIGKPRERSETSTHKIITRITDELSGNWHFGDLRKDEIEKILFERTKEYIEKKLKKHTPLQKKEELLLCTNTEPSKCLFEISDIPEPKGYTFMVEVDEKCTPISPFQPIKILFLSANPLDKKHLRLEAEYRAIDEKLRQSDLRDKFEIQNHGAVRTSDIQGYLLRYKPMIVHFSGHGNPSSEIILEDNNGMSQPVSVDTLSKLFSILKDNIRCVVLNACYSEQQAKAIADHIDCVIGMSQAIEDNAAISFASAFYQALGYGKDIKTAFELGRIQIDLDNLRDEDLPKLLAPHCKPEEIIFIKTPYA